MAAAFMAGAIDDVPTLSRQRWGLERTDLASGAAEAVQTWARADSLDAEVAWWAAVGPEADARMRVRAMLAPGGISVHEVLRPRDGDVWPRATRGCFRLKKPSAALLERLSR